MTTEKKASWIAGSVTILLLMAITSTCYYYNSGQYLKSEADRARLSQDSVLAMKQLLDKENQDLRMELTNFKGKNAELDKRLHDMDSVLSVRELRVAQLVKENAGMSALRKQLKDMKADRAVMEKQIQDLLAANQQLEAANAMLTQNVNQLEKDKLALQNQLKAADLLGLKAGDFRVDMLRNASKVTAKAGRTNDIAVSFDLPANVSETTSGNMDVYLVILDPKGNPVKNKTTKEIVLQDGKTISPIKTSSVDLSKNPQTLLMNVKLENKMKSKGVYKIQIFTTNGMIGVSQVRMN